MITTQGKHIAHSLPSTLQKKKLMMEKMSTH